MKHMSGAVAGLGSLSEVNECRIVGGVKSKWMAGSKGGIVTGSYCSVVRIDKGAVWISVVVAAMSMCLLRVGRGKSC